MSYTYGLAPSAYTDREPQARPVTTHLPLNTGQPRCADNSTIEWSGRNADQNDSADYAPRPGQG